MRRHRLAGLDPSVTRATFSRTILKLGLTVNRTNISAQPACKTKAGFTAMEVLVGLLVIGILVGIALPMLTHSNRNEVDGGQVEAPAQATKDRENERNVVLVANSALAAGAALPTSDASALIDALQFGITSTGQSAGMTFKVNLSDPEKARVLPFIKITGRVIEFDPRN
jgi:prepilin-type N-terminal cleavage/methylation domain-containing protein